MYAFTMQYMSEDCMALEMDIYVVRANSFMAPLLKGKFEKYDI